MSFLYLEDKLFIYIYIYTYTPISLELIAANIGNHCIVSMDISGFPILDKSKTSALDMGFLIEKWEEKQKL